MRMPATSVIFLLVCASAMPCWLQVQFWAPKAGGGGVTLVMAFLNGNAVPDLLTPRTLAAKFAGVLCGCASGLAVGPEGPMVQLGACVASIVSSGQAGAPGHEPARLQCTDVAVAALMQEAGLGVLSQAPTHLRRSSSLDLPLQSLVIRCPCQ